MSIFGRVADLFQAKTHKLLSDLEDPNETLDLSYEKMIVGLQDTKRHLADVVVAALASDARLAGKIDGKVSERSVRALFDPVAATGPAAALARHQLTLLKSELTP